MPCSFRRARVVTFAAVVATASCLPSLATAALIGGDSMGVLYSISETTAAKTVIGSTGVVGGFADLAFAPNGTLYGFSYSSGPDPSLYRIDPNTAVATRIGSLGLDFVFEGAFAIAANGTAYGLGAGNSDAAVLFTINLATGQATQLGTIAGHNDINGFAFRSDGRLVALEETSNSLYLLDPATRAETLLAPAGTTAGTVGGLTIRNGVGYFVTGTSGSNSLFSFNPSTGVSTLVGSLGATASSGFSALAALPSAAIPEPASWSLALVAALPFAWARRRRTSRSL